MKKLISFFVAAVLCAAILITVFGCVEENNPERAQLTSLNTQGEWWLQAFEPVTITRESFLMTTGGFVRGVCHPEENYQQIKDANIEWVRFDICNLPFNADGTLKQGYLDFKKRAQGYASRGIKVMAVTPYPEVYIEAGLDPRDEANYAEIMQIARFYAEDLQGVAAALQISNEMGIDHFTLPLTIEEAATFMGIQLKAINRYKGDIVVGYNLAGASFFTLNQLMNPYMDYVDYVGADIYLGCFEDTFKDLSWGTTMLEWAYNQTKKPIMINEFGYIGCGETKTEAQKLEMLIAYGAVGNTLNEAVAYCRSNMKKIINNENFPKKFRNHLMLVCEIDEETMTAAELNKGYLAMAAKLFDTELVSHLYKELRGSYQLTEYAHNWQDQGRFFTDFITEVTKLDYLCGAIIYCYADTDVCYICGQSNCPVETGWGLVDGEGNPKPSYYAVKDIFGEIAEEYNRYAQ